MFKNLKKAFAYLSEWLDWTLIYPLLSTEMGREQVVAYFYEKAKANPELVSEINEIISALAARDAMLKTAGRKAAEAAEPEAKIFVEEAKTPAPPPFPFGKNGGGRRDISDLKARLGLKPRKA